jgi:EAL domain-containing protein (putative c-di-GMP-specific phosphodiesterase class I)
VKTAELLDVIHKSDGALIQGFFFGKPLEKSDLTAGMVPDGSNKG